jgi:hypothetical protein
VFIEDSDIFTGHVQVTRDLDEKLISTELAGRSTPSPANSTPIKTLSPDGQCG